MCTMGAGGGVDTDADCVCVDVGVEGVCADTVRGVAELLRLGVRTTGWVTDLYDENEVFGIGE